MSYSPNRLSAIRNTIGGVGPKMWEYFSSDSIGAMLVAGYVTDATKKGLLLGDVIMAFSGTLNTALTATPSTAAEGEVSDFASQPQFAILTVTSISSGAATLAYAAAPATALLSTPRNLLDGGDFTTNPWQRGTSFSAIANTVTYTADRFFAIGGASSSISVSQQAQTDVASFSKSLRFGRGSGTDTATIYLGQVCESLDSIRAQGQQITFSFWAKAGAQFSAAASSLTVQVVSGTGTDQSAANLVAGSWTGQSNVVNTTQALTSTPTRYSFTGNVPAGCTQLGVLLSYAPTGTNNTTDTVDLYGFQLEVGPGPTPFEHLEVQEVLAICQRYAFIIGEPATGVIVTPSGYLRTAAGATWAIPLPTQMRAAPTVTVVSGNFVALGSGATTVAVAGFAAGGTHTTTMISVVTTGGSNIGTAGQGTLLQGSGGSGKITASADL